MPRSTTFCGTWIPASRASAIATRTVAVTKLIVDPLGRCVWNSKSS